MMPFLRSDFWGRVQGKEGQNRDLKKMKNDQHRKPSTCWRKEVCYFPINYWGSCGNRIRVMLFSGFWSKLIMLSNSWLNEATFKVMDLGTCQTCLLHKMALWISKVLNFSEPQLQKGSNNVHLIAQSEELNEVMGVSEVSDTNGKSSIHIHGIKVMVERVEDTQRVPFPDREFILCS